MEAKTESTFEQPLFQSETVTDIEEYLKFNRYVCWVVNRQWIFIPVFVAFAVTCCLMSDAPAAFSVVFGLILSVIDVIVLVCVCEISGRKAYRSNKSCENERSRNLFFKDHIAELRENGSDVFEYDKLHRVCETKTHFYMMISKNRGIIIPKSTCSPELISFIRSVKNRENL